MYSDFEEKISEKIKAVCLAHPDPSHDFLHVLRVVKWAKYIAEIEGANLDVVVPAAYLHDVVVIAKNDKRRAQASELSSQEAVRFLKEINYPETLISQIAHAVKAHSFTANIKAESLEAKVVQDADRLDGLGAIGVARCFSIGGVFNRKFYSKDDPFCEERVANDQLFTLDHFFVKLYKVAQTLHTPTAQAEGMRRLEFLKSFCENLKVELLIAGSISKSNVAL
ncbi:MAG: HD domain-containing protein [Oligoflexia bacterium]|nr:HD domain-containing protein [Oligoflexia bacterium]